MFKNVKLMKHGWFSRYQANIWISLLTLVIFYCINNFYDGSTSSYALVYALLPFIIIVAVLTLISLHIINKFLNIHNTKDSTNATYVLDELNTIPKIYDRFFTIFSATGLSFVLGIIALLTTGVISSILANIIWFLFLFLTSVDMFVCLNIHILRRNYKRFN